MLSNLETEKSKLVQIIMVGQPELREKLRLPQLEQLRQRITVSYHLQPLDAEETARYINHRLKRASAGAPLEFPTDVTNLIHQRSRGVPRIINVIADATLLFAYGLDRQGVDVPIAQEALAELDATGVLASYQNEGALAAQQRVVEEEARLLAAARAARTAAAASAPAVAATAAIAAAPATVLAPASIATSAADAATVGTPARPGTPADEARITPVTESRMVALAPSIATPTAMPAAVTAGPVAASVAASAALTGDVRTVSAIRPGSPRFNSISPSAYVTPSGVRVQRYEQPVPVQPSGFWDRVRRVLFGVTEPETGA
jgi:general secretion pathway protein A